jgi:peptide/nickel transport system substrate-binding protein
MCIELNLANKDAARRKLYQNKDFRIGLSHAINREELITGVWQRQGEPWQAAPTKDSIFYDEEFAKQYTEYDLELANTHLDRAGIAVRDGQGFRRLPNGDQLVVTLDVAAALSPEWQSAADIIKGMWKEVGIQLQVNTIDRTLFYDRKAAAANEHDAGTWFGPAGYVTEIQDPRCYLPYSDESIWATPWAQWFASRGKAGTEPLPAAKEQIEIYWKLTDTPDDKRREDLFRQVLAIAKDQFWIIGIGSYPPPFMVANNRLKNVASGIPETAVFNTPAHANPEMWFLDEQA